jgi:hypothetical protein
VQQRGSKAIRKKKVERKKTKEEKKRQGKDREEKGNGKELPKWKKAEREKPERKMSNRE